MKSKRSVVGAARTTWDTVRASARALPGVEEGTSYGTPALKVRGKLFIRLKEDGETIVVRTDSFERDHLLRTSPGTFFITDHYRDYPWVLVRLGNVEDGQLRDLVESAWRRTAPKRLRDDLDAQRPGTTARRPRES